MTHRAVQKMHNFNKRFGIDHAKAIYKQMQVEHLQNKPKFIFYPYQILFEQTKGYYAQYDFESQMQITTSLHTFGAWRNTLGIYKLDKDIVKDTLNSPIPAETPTEIFRNLPEWAVYVDLSEINDPNHTQGFWAVYDLMQLDKEYLCLNIIFDYNDNMPPPFNFIIDDDLTVEQSVKKLAELLRDGDEDFFEYNLEIQEKTTLICQALSCLLWLCVDEPEVTHRNEPVSRADLTRPKYSTNKKTGAFVPPSEPFLYDIGSRLGSEIRQHKESIEKDQPSKTTAKKRPHVRKAHWHGYWNGTGQGKEFKLKWLPMTFVNVRV